MATKYTHGKSKGTSDRKSSGRLSSPGGETSAPIKEFNLSGRREESPKIRVATGDYYQSQALSFPQAPTIKSFSEAPDRSQDFKNLAAAFGDVNTKLQAFTSDFWDFQKAMDQAARERAEKEEIEGEDSNTKLNKAKNALEKKAQNDPEAAASYGIFASMDQRVERERVVVKARNRLLGEIANLENKAKEIYEQSTVDESRIDESGEIVPINPSTPEWRETLLDHLKDVTDNPQAYLELNDRVQGALLNATRSVSKIHAEYKDNKAKSSLGTIFSSITLDLQNASPKRLKNGGIPSSPEFISASDEITKWREKSGISLKGYQDATQLENLLTTAAESVFNSTDPNDPGQLRQNISNMEFVLLNTNLGAGKGQSLKEIASKGDKEGRILKRLWKAAISEAKNKHSRTVDVADQNSAEKAGSALAYKIIQRDNDADLSTAALDELGVEATYEVGDKLYTVKRPPNAVNLQGVLEWAKNEKIKSLDIYSTALEQQAYAKAIDEVVDSWMKTKGVGQQNANDAWLRNRIRTSNNAIETEALITHFGNERWITRDQKNQLLQNNTLQTKLKTQREDFQKAVKKDYESIEARLVGLYQNIPLTQEELDDGYKPNETLPENWPPRLRSAYRARIEAFKQETEETFGALNEDTYEDRILKITKAREDLIKEIEKEEAKLTNQNQQEEKKEDNSVSQDFKKDDEKDEQPKEDNMISVQEHAALDKEERKNYRPIGNSRGRITAYKLKPVEPITPKKYIQELGGLRGRGNDQFNADLKTEVTTTAVYDTDIFTQQLEALEHLVKEDRDGSLNWDQTVTNLRDNRIWGLRKIRNQIDFESIDKILRVTGLTPKEYFLAQAKAHGADEDTMNRTAELLDKLFLPPSTNLQERINRTEYNKLNSDDKKRYQFKGGRKGSYYLLKDEKKNNNQASSILDRGTLIAGDLQPGMLPSINNIKEVPSNLKGQQEAAFDRVWETNTPLTQRQTEFGNALYQAGFTNEEELTTMLAIAMAESHTRSIRNHTSLNDTDESYGVLQINMLDTGATPNLGKWREEKWSWLNGRNNLFDINMNAKAAYDIVKNEPWLNDNKEGLFNAWASYEDKLHLPFMDEARKRAKEIILNQNKPRYDESSTIGGRSDIA